MINCPTTYLDHLPFDVSRETVDYIEQYIALLNRWNKRINLISPDTLSTIWHRHIIDSLQLSSYIKDHSIPIIDMGSGAGLPGLMLAYHRHQTVHLVESDRRKSLFLSEAAQLCTSNITTHNTRIENTEISEDMICITARALAPLHILIGWAQTVWNHKNAQYGIYLFPKGENWAKEVDNAREYWDFEYQSFPSITDKKSRIISILAGSVSAL